MAVHAVHEWMYAQTIKQYRIRSKEYDVSKYLDLERIMENDFFVVILVLLVK